MPELPEVEVVRAGLEPAVTDALITSVTVFDDRSLRRHDGPSEDFIERLTGRRMLAAVRRGKFMWFPLDSPDGRNAAGVSAPAQTSVVREAVVAHLGMSGQVLLRGVDADDPLTRIRLDIEHPRLGALRLNFVDQRIFGSMAIVDLIPTTDGRPGGLGHAAAVVPTHVAHISRDPLDPAFDDERFFAQLAKKGSGIKRVLLDQTVISGIGNIYADESLWAARIHYDQPASSLSRARAATILAEVRLVLTKALAEGGTSFDAQYVNVNGASGYFSHSLNAYGQHGNPCPRCGREIQRHSFMNRGSHFCAFCQRMRAPRPSTSSGTGQSGR